MEGSGGVLFSFEQRENIGAKMVPLYAARIEDLGPGVPKTVLAAVSRASIHRTGG
jgi:hypothetical protein